jgi:NADH-quinone oxidoreductase subunit C
LSSAAEPETDQTADAPQIEARHQAVADLFAAELGDAVLGTHLVPGLDPWIRVHRDAWQQAGELARDQAHMRFFDFLSAIDWMPSPFGRDEDAVIDRTSLQAGADPSTFNPGYAGGDTRFQVLARVSNVATAVNVVLKADLDDDLTIGTWVGVYAGANWHEREAWEMYGITFEGHPGLRHIYLPTEFEGHPLRKDFPLLARVVKPWPGIVDVEPMPGGGPEDEEEETPEAES